MSEAAGDYTEAWPHVGTLLKQKIRKTCTRHLIFDRLPIIGWARGYRLSYVYQDLLAGITVGLTAIPQGIAYGVVAGLEPQYGLYAELVASFVYCVLGSCRNVTIGPTSIMALMVQSYTLLNPDFAILAAFITGIIVLAMGIFNLGFLVHFISIPVVTGFTTAAALFIGSLQVKSLLGLTGRSQEFLGAWIDVFENIGQTKLWDSVLGFSSIAFLVALKLIGDKKHWKWASARKYLSLARNALVVIIGSVLAYLLTRDGERPPFAITGQIVPGFPPFGPPPFFTVVGNETMGFSGMVGTLGMSILSIPMVAILEIVAVSKAFSKGKTVDATQEMIAMGCCNILGSCVRSMPVTGSFTRTAINEASGVRTPFGGIVTGTMVMLSIGFLTNTFQYIPKATLAAVIITAMISMLEFSSISVIWRTRRADIIPFMATFIGCLALSLDYGIVIGIVVNLLFILYATARPKTEIVHTKVHQHNVLIVEPDQSLVYSAAENLKFRIMKHAMGSAKHGATSVYRDDESAPDGHKVSVVVISGVNVRTIDMTVAKYLQSLANDLRLVNKTILFWNWRPQPTGAAWRLSEDLGKLFRKSDTIEELLAENSAIILLEENRSTLLR